LRAIYLGKCRLQYNKKPTNENNKKKKKKEKKIEEKKGGETETENNKHIKESEYDHAHHKN
jgi:hypothetical protein